MRDDITQKMAEKARTRERIRKNLIYTARRKGYVINTKRKCILADNIIPLQKDKTIQRLIKEFGFAIPLKMF